MTAPAEPATLRVVRVHPDQADTELGTITLVDGRLEFSNPAHADLLRRWRISGAADGEIFAELAQGGWSNGYVSIVPATEAATAA